MSTQMYNIIFSNVYYNKCMDILKRINELREKKGWTMYKLAEESMITQSTLANMYTRNTLPSITTLLSICKGLGITPAQFFAVEETDATKEEEKQLISLYRNLSDNNKKAVINLINNLQDNK